MGSKASGQIVCARERGRESSTREFGLGAHTRRLRFPGQIYDIESNLHSNGHRDYDPRLGRYVESDRSGSRAGSTPMLMRGMIRSMRSIRRGSIRRVMKKTMIQFCRRSKSQDSGDRSSRRTPRLSLFSSSMPYAPRRRGLPRIEQSWPRLSGQVPADFEWISAGVC
jgi:RHS repeat-associated protein